MDEVKANHDHSFIINVEKAEDKVATKLSRCGSNFFVQDREGVTKFMTLYDVSPSKRRVCKARHIRSGVTRAVKVMAKVSPESELEFAREIEIMSAFAHPHIVRLFETFEDEESVVLVMELCSGGNLMQKIFETTRFTESLVALLMLQLFRALKCMHTRGFCHRNLKPENLLFLSRRPIESNVLKVAQRIRATMAAFRRRSPVRRIMWLRKSWRVIMISPRISGVAGSSCTSCSVGIPLFSENRTRLS